MPSYGAKILNNAVSSLNAQQAVIANIGNNIANANTEGYTRRRVELETRASQSSSGINIGSGVNVAGVLRISDQYLEKILRDTLSTQEDAVVQDEFLDRVEAVFSLVGENDTIGSTLTAFFSSLNNLKADPANIERRREVIERADDLVAAVQTGSKQIASLQAEADARIETELNSVNTIAKQIAEMNGIIAGEEGSGQRTAADARDTRDKLIQDLAERVSFSMVEDERGQVTLTLANGFALVSGTTSRSLNFTRTPSFDPATPPSLSGGTLGYIVYDYSGGSGTAHLDLTQTLATGGGSIGGLLKTRGYHTNTSDTNAFQATGTLIDMAARIESIAINLLTGFNTTYRGPNIASNDLAGDLDGNSPIPFGFFTFSGAVDGNANGAADINDLTALRAANPSAYASFAQLIDLRSRDPRTIAAATDADPAAGPAVYTPGDGSNLSRLVDWSKSNQTFSVGSYTFTGTLDDVYSDSVSYLGNLKARTTLNAKVAEEAHTAALNRRDALSAVNLDEEFADLIKFQRAFEASARMIKVADELLQQLVSLI